MIVCRAHAIAHSRGARGASAGTCFSPLPLRAVLLRLAIYTHVYASSLVVRASNGADWRSSVWVNMNYLGEELVANASHPVPAPSP